IYRTPYANSRLLISWALSFGARITGPPERVAEARERIDRLIDSHRGELPVAAVSEGNGRGRGDAAIRPERFARLVTLASVLIAAGRAGERLLVADVC